MDVLRPVMAEVGRRGPVALAEATHLTPSRLAALVDELRAKGLVEQTTDGGAPGSVILATEAGRLVFAEVASVAAALDASLVAPLSIADRATLRRLVSQVAAVRPGLRGGHRA